MVQGRFEDAFKYANVAYTGALSAHNDSLKVICGLQLGYTYMHKREVLMAFKHYTTALELAEDMNSPVLVSEVYHYLSDMYKKLGDDVQAKDYIRKSMELNKKHGLRHGLVDDYISMGKLSDNVAEEHFNHALSLSDSLGDMFGKAQAERFSFSIKMFSGKPVELVQYLNSRKDLHDIFVRTGPHFVDWIIAEVYLYGNMYDSAYTHFKLAYTSFDNLYVRDLKQIFMGEFADCCAKLNKTEEAITAYQSTLNVTKVTSNITTALSCLSQLRGLYEKKGDYRTAYLYSIQYENVKDSINRMVNDREIALKEIDVLEKQKEREEEQQKIEDERRHNLQYMGITVSVASVFILLIFLGMFRVSQNSIRILSFFAFIFFFEFIILLLDHRIHDMVHGEPLKIWLVKIVLLSILLPLHHRMEEWLTHYLVSRKLVAIRERASFRAWLQKIFSDKHSE